MRRALKLLHRWVGLLTSVFLFIAGLTGAVISWERELDELLNPQLFRARPSSAARSLAGPAAALALADRLEAADPRVLITHLPLAVTPGNNLLVSVRPRLDPAAGKPFQLGFDQ